ncbi:mitochondrial ornithine carrier protein, putative [Ichthyophthirius multifiliis]|uniref:Mitochondrial ornithine carrier protein, putative n=1 Tax=Ichthyophthirius multifiliis TaxID=5932 RepID=G0QU61_ICHMU|nr:mitochondrial ornithine carrier protein, putative [Ichthyophthirius multifiliis]EGR31242.1 mitochondrial ornithine carrier protein, putative [Ichthyophthirius multifiliis]|eukprot:XP_004034728.1 mitochondrial ornithine carrier protein, putative [Ichthyophthirius multifiliis]
MLFKKIGLKLLYRGITPVLFRNGLQVVIQEQHPFCFPNLLTLQKYNSFKALFRGGSMPLIAQIFEGSLLFGIIDCLKYKFQVKSDISMSSLFCYFVAGAVDGAFLSPFELIKIRRQLQSNQQCQKEGILQIIRCIYKDKGILGFFRGCSSTVLKESFGNSIYFYSYYYSVSLLDKLNERKSEKVRSFDSFLCGSFSGVAYWLFIYPIDTIKTIIQSHDKNIPNVFQYTKDIIQKDGFYRLYRGICPVLIRSIPSNVFSQQF